MSDAEMQAIRERAEKAEDSDLEFIAYARTKVPLLIDEIHRLKILLGEYVWNASIRGRRPNLPEP